MKKLMVLILSVIILISVSGCGAGGSHDKYYSIDHFYIKEEGEAFRNSYNELVKDTYDWYKSIEGNNGVYIIHFEQFPKELLKEWKDNGYMENIPENDLDYYTASVNYLEDNGLSFSEQEKQMIQEGVRYYLLPDTLSESEIQAMKLYLNEDALYGLEGETLTDTAFRHNKRIEFRTYHFDGALEVPGGEEIRNPVIYVASTSNMKYFEAESLIATGLSDAYIRLTEEAYNEYAKNSLPAELKNKKVTFLGLSKISN